MNGTFFPYEIKSSLFPYFLSLNKVPALITQILCSFPGMFKHEISGMD